MQFFSFALALFCVTAAFAKSDAGLFNQAVRESIKLEMKKDGEVYKKASRAPASIPSAEPSSEYNQLDKMEKHHKQIGRPNW